MRIYGNAQSGEYEDDGDERMHPQYCFSFDGDEHDDADEQEQEEYDDTANEALQYCSMLLSAVQSP